MDCGRELDLGVCHDRVQFRKRWELLDQLSYYKLLEPITKACPPTSHHPSLNCRSLLEENVTIS
jgi:hypothetical protein